MTCLSTSRIPVLAAVIALTSLSLAPRTLRAETEAYGGLGIGYSTFEVETVDFAGTPLNVDFAGSALALRSFLGFTWGDYVGVEAGYIDFGTVNDRIANQPGQQTLNQGIETSGFNLSAVGRYPLNEELHAIAKVGMISWDSEATIETVPGQVKADGTDLIWGVGLDFRGSGRIHVRIEGELVDIDFADSWWVATASVIYGFPLGR